MNDLVVHVRAVIDDFVNGMQKSESAVKSFSSSATTEFTKVEQRAEKMSNLWKSIFEAFVGIEIVRSLNGIADAANRASETLEIAAQNAKNFGKSFNVSGMDDWVKKFAASSRGGGYGIDDMRNSVQQFTSIGLSAAQTQRAVADAADLAAAKNISFAEATHIVTEALTGHVEMLTRYGIISREAAAHIHTTEQAMEAVEKAAHGDAAERMNGLAGAMGRLHNATLLLMESFGKGLVPYFEAAANALANLATAFSKLPPGVQQAAAGFAFFTAGAVALGLTLPALVKGLGFIQNGFSLVIGIGSAFGRLLVGPLTTAIAAVTGWLRIAAVTMGTDLVGAEAAAALGASEFIVPALAIVAVVGAIIAAVVALTGHWSDAMKFLRDAWNAFYHDVVDKGGHIHDILRDIALAVTPATSSIGISLLFDDLKRSGEDAGRAIGNGVKWSIGEISSLVKGAWNAVFGAHVGLANVPNAPFDNAQPNEKTRKPKKDTSAADTARTNNSIDKQLAAWSAKIGKMVESDLIAQAYKEHPQISTAGLQSQLQALEHAKAMDEATGKLTRAKSDDYAVREAQVKEQIAKIDEENAARKLLIARIIDQLQPTREHDQAIKAAADNLVKAHEAVTKAAGDSAVAIARAKYDSERHDDGRSLLDGLRDVITRAVPGIEQKRDPQTGQFLGFSMNWASVLMQAVEKSKSFADIMNVVNELMQVFANIIDAFRPVIDLLLKGVIFVANGFIDLWNVIARLLNLFGLHVQLLQQLSYDVQATEAPFIKIVHDIPTLNELATGKVSPLYAAGTHDYIYNSITDPMINQMKDPSLGGGLLGMLGEILGAILALKLVMGLFGGLFGGAGGGGGGGLFGWLGSLFTSGSANPSAGPLQWLLSSHMGSATNGGPLTFLNSAWGNALGGAAAGYLLGGPIAGMFGENQQNGAIGGALGGGLASGLGLDALLGVTGPWGMLAGVLLGSVVGGMFGNHFNPKDEPDQNLPGYQSWLKSFNNGSLTDGGFQLQHLFQGVDPSTLTGQALADYQELQKLGYSANMANGSGGIAHEKDDMFTLGTGAQIQVEQYIALVNRAMQEFANGVNGAVGAIGGNIAAGATALSNAVDASTNELANAASATGAAAAAIGQVVAQTGASTASTTTNSPSFVLQHFGDINNQGDLNDVAQQLALLTQRYANMSKYNIDRVAGAPTQ